MTYTKIEQAGLLVETDSEGSKIYHPIAQLIQDVDFLTDRNSKRIQQRADYIISLQNSYAEKAIEEQEEIDAKQVLIDAYNNAPIEVYTTQVAAEE